MDDEDGFRTTPVPQPPRQYPLLSTALEHGPLVAGIVAALIFAVRCVIVTGGDPYTASLLLAQTSYGDAIIAFLFSVAPVSGVPQRCDQQKRYVTRYAKLSGECSR
jgi:hypothetical protein